jgi:hypothetical protein
LKTIDNRNIGGRAMAISPRRLRIPHISEAFPLGTVPNGSDELSVTWDEILWAALTLGRPSTHHVFQHGAASMYEAIFRISLVRMALEQYGPRATRLRRTSAFKSLDPTEKGAVSYFLGMVFCKVFASRLLSTPWLLHLDIYKTTFSGSALGRSRPDLFGQQSGTGAWHAFETKGRASKPSAADRTKAKLQARRLLSVGGIPCSLRVGTFTYFAEDALRFQWIDPPRGENRSIDVPEIGGNWRYYYEPVRSLWRGDITASKSGPDELLIALPEFDLKIRVHPLLVPLFLLRVWERVQPQMLRSYETLVADGYQPDGLKVECGPTWVERQSRPEQFG